MPTPRISDQQIAEAYHGKPINHKVLNPLHLARLREVIALVDPSANYMEEYRLGAPAKATLYGKFTHVEVEYDGNGSWWSQRQYGTGCNTWHNHAAEDVTNIVLDNPADAL